MTRLPLILLAAVAFAGCGATARHAQPISATLDPSFTFSTDAPASSWYCSLDGAAYVKCSSPKSYTLVAGKHMVLLHDNFTIPASCTGSGNTPGGADPWGGCFPGPNNTGVPAGTVLTTVNTDETAAQAVAAGAPSDNTGWTYSTGNGAIVIDTAGAIIDQINSTGVVDNGNGTGYTMKNSSMTGPIESGGTNNGNVLIEESTLNGGRQTNVGTVAIPNVDVEGSYLSGGKDELNCEGSNCTIRNSYLTGQSNSDSNSHQQGFDTDGSSNDLIDHNSIACTPTLGQCTADVTFSTDGADTNITGKHNLFVASPNEGACIYPGPNAPSVSATLANIAWTTNVFQKGSSGLCGYGEPVYGWYPSRCNTTSGGAPPSTAANTSCTWTGNVWDDGTTLNEPFQ